MGRDGAAAMAGCQPSSAERTKLGGSVTADNSRRSTDRTPASVTSAGDILTQHIHLTRAALSICGRLCFLFTSVCHKFHAKASPCSVSALYSLADRSRLHSSCCTCLRCSHFYRWKGHGKGWQWQKACQG